MAAYWGWLVASISLSLCILLWFLYARSVMNTRRSTVESAQYQLSVYHEKYRSAQEDDPTIADVLARSESICQQAIRIYNRTLHNPGIFLPAILLGFRSLPIGKGS